MVIEKVGGVMILLFAVYAEWSDRRRKKE